MIRKLPVLLILLIASSAIAAEPVALSIDGPDTMAPGAARLFTVGGLAKWTDAAVVTLPEKNDSVVVRLRDADDKPVLYVQFGTASKELHLILIDFAVKRTAVKSVGSTSPQPDPPKPPDPPTPPGPNPPTPGAKLQVAFYVETSKLTSLPRAQQAMLGSLTLRDTLKTKGHRFVGLLDPDQRKTAPPELAPWFLALADGDSSRPRVAVAPIDGGDIRVYDLPADEAGLLLLLEGKKQ